MVDQQYDGGVVEVRVAELPGRVAAAGLGGVWSSLGSECRSQKVAVRV